MNDAKLQFIEIAKLIPTPDNRRFLTEGDVAALAEQIAAVGVLQPVIARPHPTQKGKYDLRAGSRRLAASRMAGLTTIPTIVREMSDEQALEVTIVENLERPDLHPLEHARGIGLMVERGQSHEQIAAKLGHDVRWVARLAQLQNLSKKWQDAIAKRTHRVHEWGIGLLELVAKHSHDLQDLFFNSQVWGLNRLPKDVPTIVALREAFADLTHFLSDAPWDMADATLVPRAGSCEACSKRSGCQPLLWDTEELEIKKGKIGERCLDPKCFAEKKAAHVKLEFARLAGEHGKKLTVVASSPYSVAAPIARAVGKVEYASNYTRCKKDDKGAVPVLNVDTKGGVTYMRKIGQAGGSGGAKPKAKKKTPKSIDEKREELKARREKLAIEKLCKQLDEIDENAIIKNDAIDLHGGDLLRYVIAFPDFIADGCMGIPNTWETFDRLAETGETDLAASLMVGVIQQWAWILTGNTDTQFADRVCQALGIDFGALLKAAATELPEPENWAKEPAKKAKPKKETKRKEAKKVGRLVKKRGRKAVPA